MLGISTNGLPTDQQRQQRRTTMTKTTIAPAKLTATNTKTSLKTSQARYASGLSNERTNVPTATSSIKLGLAKLSTASRVRLAVQGNCGQPVDSLSSSPLSPSVSNGRTSTTSDSVSERSIPSSSLSKMAIVGGRTNKLEAVAVPSRGASTPGRPRVASYNSSTSIHAPAVASGKSRLLAPRSTQVSSTLPKLVIKRNSSYKSDTPSAHCDRSSSLRMPESSASKPIRQLKQPTSIPLVKRTISSSNSIVSGSGTTSSKQKALLPCGRSINSTGNGLPKAPVCMGGRSNNLVAVVRPQQQQQHDKRGEDVPVTRLNATTKTSLGTLRLVGKQESDYEARIAASATTTTTKLKTTQQHEGKSEEDHGAKNEAANLNHKDVNSPTEEAAAAAATPPPPARPVVNNQNCLTNNLRNQQDEEERPREKGSDGLVNGHEVKCASNEDKQKEDGQGIPVGNAKDLNDGTTAATTTSGRNGESGPNDDIRVAHSLLLVAPLGEASVAIPTAGGVALKSSSSERGNKSPPPSETKSLTTRENDKDGQIVPATDSQIASSSASGGGLSSVGFSDIKQHEKQPQQQISKCSPPVQHRLALSGAHTRMPKLQQKQHDDLANGYKCRHNKLDTKASDLQQQRPAPPRSLASGLTSKHEIASDSLCFKTRSNKASSSSCATTNPSGLVGGGMDSIGSSGCVLSKPMGQRVLSLMMLDAGLLPSGKDHPTNEERKSHVCLQSEPSSVEPNCLMGFPKHLDASDDNNNNDNVDIETSKSNAPSQMNANGCRSGTNVCIRNPYLDDLTPSIGPDQGSNGTNCIGKEWRQSRSTIRLERGNLFSPHSECLRGASTSLPASPRLSRAARTGSQIQPSDRRFEHLNLDDTPQMMLNEKKGYQRATERWYSPARDFSTTTSTSVSGSGDARRNLMCDDNRRIETHSVTSSCSSLNSHCPPMLSLSNQLDAMDFSRMIKANVNVSSQGMNEENHSHRQNRIASIPDAMLLDSKNELPSQDQLEIKPTQSLERTEQVHRPQGLSERSNLVCKDSEDNLSSKIDRLDELRRATEKMRELSASGFNESDFDSSTKRNIQLSQRSESSIEPAFAGQALGNTNKIKTPFDQNETHALESQSRTMDHHQSGRRQPRSNSISGQEFHHLGGDYNTQRLKQQPTPNTHHSPFVDSNQYYNQKILDYSSSSPYSHNLTADRSLSPSSLSGRPSDFYVPKRSSSIKYPLEKQPLTRNQIHASLECLNTIYSDYGQQNQKQQLLSSHHPRQYSQHLHHHQQQQQQQPFKHRASFQSGHYANNYVLATAPADAVVNQSAEQDLAAAAMAAPQYYNPNISSGSTSSNKMHSMNQSPQNHNHYLAQGSFNNRSTASMSHSPLHRRIIPGPMASILNQISSSTSNPLRAGHSSLSLASSTYLIEDKLQNEIKQLQSELKSEKEKNEALNSQLSINSNLMAAFEQSLTTLNSRLRQMTAINERKDKEIDLLRSQLDSSNHLTVGGTLCETSEKSTSPINGPQNGNSNLSATSDVTVESPQNHATGQSSGHREGANERTNTQDRHLDEQGLLKVIEDLRRQLIEKDRLLTDTRLEALSAAHQLEQLESRMNGEQSLMVNEDDLDEGVMVVNHSPSDSDAITDSAHFSDQLNLNRSNQYDHSNHGSSKRNHQMQTHHQSQRDGSNLDDMILFTPTRGHNTSSESHAGGLSNSSNHSNDDSNEAMQFHSQQRQQQQQDNQSDHSSSDYHDDDKSPSDTATSQLEFRAHNGTTDQAFESHEAMNKMLDKLLVSN